MMGAAPVPASRISVVPWVGGRTERYELIGKIAAGGMADIFLARDAEDGATSVIKRLLPRWGSDREVLGLFEQEIRLGLILDHQNLVRASEGGVLGGLPFLAMEHIPGLNAIQLLRTSHLARRSVDVSTVVRIGLDLLSALEHVHQAVGADGQPLQIVHRDVSPANILIREDGVAKLIDFGVAMTRATPPQRPGVLRGKVAYIAPEQFRGGPVDAAGDVWSAGVVLWELLAGCALFHHPAQTELIAQVLRAPIAPIGSRRADVPEALGAVVAKLLARDRAVRYASAGEAHDALAGCASRLRLDLRRSSVVESIAALRHSAAFPDALPRAVSRPPPAALEPPVVSEPNEKRKLAGLAAVLRLTSSRVAKVLGRAAVASSR